MLHPTSRWVVYLCNVIAVLAPCVTQVAAQATGNPIFMDPTAARRLCPANFTRAEAWSKANENNGTLFNDYMLELPYYLPALHPALLFRNDKRLYPKHDITVATQLSLSRLPSLQMQCSYWPGTLAAALYLPVHKGKVHLPKSVASFEPGLMDTQGDLQQVLLYLQKILARMDAHIAGGLYSCALHLQAFVEYVPDEWGQEFAYPVNALRNKALEMVETEAVILLDGDFVTGPSRYMDDLLLNSDEEYEQLLATMRAEQAVYVLPALEPSRMLELHQQMQTLRSAVQHSDKRRVAHLLAQGRVRTFQQSFHKVTDIAQWADTDTAYPIEYDSLNGTYVSKTAYEPYLFGLRSMIPWYDERLRGYHYNKVAHVYQVFATGAKFLVHPQAFVMHTPHLSDTQTKADTTFYRPMEKYLMVEVMSRPLRGEGPFEPVVADWETCPKGTQEALSLGPART